MEGAGYSKPGRPVMGHRHSGNAILVAAGVVGFAVIATGVVLGWVILRSTGDSNALARNTAGNAAASALSYTESWWRPTTESTAAMSPATMIRVIDGDSVLFQLADGEKEEVRLIGLDAPEMQPQRDAYATESAKYVTAQLREHPKVFLEKGADTRDKYGRLLAYVWFSEPKRSPSSADVREKMLNAKMLLDGFAKLYSKAPNTRYAALFHAYASYAKAAGRGLWDARLAHSLGSSASWSPALTTDFRRPALPYVGNLTSKKFHLITCDNAQKMKRSNRISFATREDAIAEGYVPCGLCEP